MRHAPAPLLAAALAALAACGQPFLSAKVEVPELRITQPPRDFPAATFDPAYVCSILGVQDCSGVDLAPLDVGGALDEKGVTAELRLTGFGLHLVRGDARGIERLVLDVVDRATGRMTRVASYARPAVAASPVTDVAVTPTGVELVHLLKDGELATRIEVELDPAYIQTGFTASVQATFSVKAIVDYDPYL